MKRPGFLQLGREIVAVVEQRVLVAHAEEGRRKAAKVGVEGRDGRVAPILGRQPGGEHLVEPPHDGRGEDEVALTPVALARRHPEVEDAKHEVRPAEGPGRAVALAQAQERQRRKVCAGRLAS